MTLVKICGISRVEDAMAAAKAGADFVGMIFAASRRQVDAVRAAEIITALPDADSKPRTIGVFVNEDAEEINRVADACGLDMVQLSGDEPLDRFQQIERFVFRVVHVIPGTTVREILVRLKEEQLLFGDNVRLILDTGSTATYGGTGETFDWSLAADIAREVPLILAGGLTPENVAEAIDVVNPWAVDVSSGVETGGAKDADRIRAFIDEVRRADGA